MYVVQVGGGRREQADVAGPAHTFVALRAVGGDGDEVGATLTIRQIGVQTVEQRVGAGEFAGAVHYRMVYAAVHVLGGEFACVAFEHCA